MDKIRRRLGIPEESLVSSEHEQRESQAWQEAELTQDYNGPIYAATLAAEESDGNPVSVVAYVRADSLGRFVVNIPTRDETPVETLVNSFYQEATFFGEIDPERFETMATDWRHIEQLMVLMNRQAANVGINQNSNWFYNNFGVDHLMPYGEVYIGSRGGPDHFIVTIEQHDHQRDAWANLTHLEQSVNESLPHLSFSPVPKKAYLQKVPSVLPFLPRDWEIS